MTSNVFRWQRCHPKTSDEKIWHHMTTTDIRCVKILRYWEIEIIECSYIETLIYLNIGITKYWNIDLNIEILEPLSTNLTSKRPFEILIYSFGIHNKVSELAFHYILYQHFHIFLWFLNWNFNFGILYFVLNNVWAMISKLCTSVFQWMVFQSSKIHILKLTI